MTEQPTDLPTAVEILTRTAGLDDRHRWAELVNAGAALLSAGRPEGAREVLEVAVHDTRRQLGGDDDRDAARRCRRRLSTSRSSTSRAAPKSI